MDQIRIHGRGGQGVVTASELIAMAAFYEGKQTQAFPHFGVERTGAPIRAYTRISNNPILTRERVYNPTILLIQDHTLITEDPEITAGVDKNTFIIINAPKDYKLEKKLPSKKIYYSPATEIALQIFKKNIVNTVILGALARQTGLISLESLKKAIHEKFKSKGTEIINKNIKAVTLAYKK
ncbi:MAG: pyruvate ferredoxin oxidoreductase gamma subunit [Patescibacteria group bacterium]|nr:pyruvate ferredoxin oxidoreductase gamma subunit [Patescibacteria group bacterium]